MLSAWMRFCSALCKSLPLVLGGCTAPEGSSTGAVATRGRVDVIEPGNGPRWGTLSGLTAHPTNPSLLYAVTDKQSPPARIVEIDVSGPAPRVVRQIGISAPGFDDLDFEGIVARPDGGFWLASEGEKRNSPPNLLLEVDARGTFRRSIDLPQAIAERVRGKGYEGVALEVTPTGARLYVAFQGRLSDDPKNLARIGSVDPASGQWTFFFYPLEPLPSGDFAGLSDLLHLGNRRFAAIERDGEVGPQAIKWITTFDLGTLTGAPPDSTPPALTKHLAVDLVPLFTKLGHSVEKEIEGLAVAADGEVYAITDNDNDRPTVLLRLGKAADVFGP